MRASPSPGFARPGVLLAAVALGGTGITNFLQNGGAFEEAGEIAAHESTRTTRI
jgi:hypothetical protein